MKQNTQQSELSKVQDLRIFLAKPETRQNQLIDISKAESHNTKIGDQSATLYLSKSDPDHPAWVEYLRQGGILTDTIKAKL